MAHPKFAPASMATIRPTDRFANCTRFLISMDWELNIISVIPLCCWHAASNRRCAQLQVGSRRESRGWKFLWRTRWVYFFIVASLWPTLNRNFENTWGSGGRLEHPCKCSEIYLISINIMVCTLHIPDYCCLDIPGTMDAKGNYINRVHLMHYHRNLALYFSNGDRC